MAFVQPGFNFRGTLAFVTDGSDEYFVAAADTYPKTYVAGVVGGWEVGGAGGLDRAVQDRRLSGVGYAFNNTSPQPVFRVDLPAVGDYNIRLAAGDQAGNQSQYVQLVDNATVFVTMTALFSAGNEFRDATAVARTAAAWPGSNAAVLRTFASTIFRMRICDPGGVAGGITTIAHLQIIPAGGGGGSFPVGARSAVRGMFDPVAVTGGRRRTHTFNKESGLWLPSR